MSPSAGIGDAGVAAICGVLAGRVPLRLLDLSRCGLTAGAASHLRSALGVSSAYVQSHQWMPAGHKAVMPVNDRGPCCSSPCSRQHAASVQCLQGQSG